MLNESGFSRMSPTGKVLGSFTALGSNSLHTKKTGSRKRLTLESGNGQRQTPYGEYPTRLEIPTGHGTHQHLSIHRNWDLPDSVTHSPDIPSQSSHRTKQTMSALGSLNIFSDSVTMNGIHKIKPFPRNNLSYTPPNVAPRMSIVSNSCPPHRCFPCILFFSLSFFPASFKKSTNTTPDCVRSCFDACGPMCIKTGFGSSCVFQVVLVALLFLVTCWFIFFWNGDLY